MARGWDSQPLFAAEHPGRVWEDTQQHHRLAPVITPGTVSSAIRLPAHRVIQVSKQHCEAARERVTLSIV